MNGAMLRKATKRRPPPQCDALTAISAPVHARTGKDMSTEDNTELTALRACGEGVHPYPARWLHVILLAVGLIGWLTFILACVGGPAWSPDSSKALFAWHDFEGGRYNVAVYDRATRKSHARCSLVTIGLRPRWEESPGWRSRHFFTGRRCWPTASSE